MTIQHVKCPKCRTGANIPVAMATVRCPKCAHIWNPNEPEDSEEDPDNPSSASGSKRMSGSSAKLVKVVGGVVGALLVLAIVVGAVRYLTQSDSRTGQPLGQASNPAPAARPTPVATPEPYREIKLPESTRQQIYRDYRTAAGSSVEKPIPLPKDWDSRKALDATLNKVLERELTLHASMHNIEVDDVIEILKEGNAKKWK
jgi:hypothetical protein